jgi:hypothetical protein
MWRVFFVMHTSLASVLGPPLRAGPGSVGGCPSAFFSTVSPVAAKGVRGAPSGSGHGLAGGSEGDGDGDDNDDDNDDDEFEAALASAIGKAVTRDARNVFGGHADAAEQV